MLLVLVLSLVQSSTVWKTLYRGDELVFTRGHTSPLKAIARLVWPPVKITLPCMNLKRRHPSCELYSSKCYVIPNFQLLYLKNLNLLVLEKLVQSDHTRPAYFEYFMIHTVSNCAWEIFRTDLSDSGKIYPRDCYSNLMP